MFRSAHDLLLRLPESDDPVRNALLESLAIHGRGLAYFFHCPAQEDDWTVEDLGAGLKRAELPATLKTWREQANKRVAHITRTRENPLAAWEVQEARASLQESINRVKEALREQMPPDWIGDRAAKSTYFPDLLSTDCGPFHGLVGVTGPAGPPSSPGER
jgi:hypothetical protein